MSGGHLPGIISRQRLEMLRGDTANNNNISRDYLAGDLNLTLRQS